ncbi:MAG: GTPase domain-containing protein [Pseudomonadota bacterium]
MLNLLPTQIASKLRYAIYAGVVALAFWALSTFFVSLDKIESPILSAAYAFLVLVPLIGVGAYFLLRRSKHHEFSRGAVREPPKPRPSAEDRIKHLAKKLELDDQPSISKPAPSPDAATQAPSLPSSRQMIVAVLGTEGVGRPSLIRALKKSCDDDKLALNILLHDVLISEISHEEVIGITTMADVVMLVLDQDIRSNEHAAIEPALDSDKPIVIVLNKADLFSKKSLEETLQSIRNRLCDAVGSEFIVAASADPMMRSQIVVHQDGREEEREVRAQPDVSEVLAVFERLALANGMSSIAISVSENSKGIQLNG